MFISRFLYMKAEEERREIAREEARAEGMKEGIAEGIAVGEARGRAMVNNSWDSWLRRMRDAERDGKPFNEPPPDF